MAKTLIAFFSRADENYFGGAMRYIEVGNTEVAAGKIRDRIDAEVFKMEMKQPYSKEYNPCIEEAKRDLREKARPELVSMSDRDRWMQRKGAEYYNKKYNEYLSSGFEEE